MICMTDADYKQYIVTSLQLAEQCINDTFPAQVDLLWSLSGNLSGCDMELHYLLTRLQAIKLLMGCYTRQIDVRTGRGERHSRSTATSRANGWSQATSTMSSVGFSDALGENRFRDLATGSSDSGSDSANWLQSRSNGASRFDDVGSGAGESNSSASRTARGRRFSNETSRTDSDSLHTGKRGGCNYSFSQSGTRGLGLNVVVVGVSRTATKNTSDVWIQDSSMSNDIAKSSTDALRTSQARSTSNVRSRRTSSSYFNALADGYDWSTAQSHGEAHSTSYRDAAAHAHGLGTGNQNAKDRAEMTSRGDNLSHDESASRSDATRTGFSVMDDAKAHQRFEHLRQLYDNTQALIEIKRHHMRRSGRIIFGAILTCTMDGFCRVPTATNISSLPQQPFA